MNWKIFFLKFFRNVILGIVIGTLALGVIGYLLAGQEGFENGASWGAVLGLIGGSFSGLVILARKWGQPGGYEMHPGYIWFVKKSKEEDPKY